FKVLGNLSWNEITKHKGLGWDRVPEKNMKYRIPESLNKKELYHLKISRKARVWGYREGDAFHLVWFDPDHQVTPER
ncbi:hypothetical protein R0J91_19595, partial [Micrococcus sp. SIMBA_131]